MRVRPDRIAPATEGLSNQYAQFFAAKNPGYLNGDYLACIGELSYDNCTRLGQRFFDE
jgi:hypothetical protein